MEIERKFLMGEYIPWDAVILDKASIESGYLSINPEVRIQKKTLYRTDEIIYKLTIKGNGNLSRIEVEKDLTKEEFEELRSMINYEFITKDYMRVALANGDILQYSKVDKEKNSFFIYGEVEFLTEEMANKFAPPDYFGEEVTYNSDYKMKNYWLRTRIDKIKTEEELEQEREDRYWEDSASYDGYY